MAVLGVDACKGGWVGIRLTDGGPPAAFGGGDFVELVAAAGPVEVVGIDIPIGLPETGLRQADALTRQALGPRRASVFVTPPRAVLEAPTHAEATALARRLCGTGVSQQAYGLRHRILEVDAWLAAVDADARTLVVEVHPELSFATLAGRPLPDPKGTWAGLEQRRRLLADAGIVLEGDLGLSGFAARPDDVLDAAAAAWSAARVARGRARRLPDPPEPVAGGRLAAIHA